jgi:uncharacterized protein (DUF697 family)
MTATSTARLGQAKSFWKVIKSVSIAEIEREANRPFSLALVGTPEKRREALRRLYPDSPEDAAHPILRAFDSTSTEVGFPAETGSFDLVIDAGGGRVDSPPGVLLYSVDELGGWDRVVERMLEEHPERLIALARRFPGLREEVSRRIIRETALANAEFAMLNALPGLFPLLGLLIPTAAVGDIIMLAKNQAMMLFRLAATYDLPLDLRSRARDLAPLLGNAFGWRALAREIIGFVPGGVGIVARGTIAYAGTIAVGEGLRRFYALGKHPTRAQINYIYREAYAGAKETVRGIARRLRLRGKPDEAKRIEGVREKQE